MDTNKSIASDETVELLVQHLADPNISWSIGTFGAIGEFHQTREEPKVVSSSHRGGQIMTDRGGIRVELPEMVCIAPYELLRRGRRMWSHGVTICASRPMSLCDPGAGS